MASLQSAAAASPSPASHKGYDPEIKDIADYVHNKPIDSELAVSSWLRGPGQPRMQPAIFTPHNFPRFPTSYEEKSNDTVANQLAIFAPNRHSLTQQDGFSSTL
jgi:hypothetical protein